jgi:hypothetical protein
VSYAGGGGFGFDMAAPFHGERCAGRCGVNCGNPSPPAPLSPPLPPSEWPRAPLNLVARRANLASMSRLWGFVFDLISLDF